MRGMSEATPATPADSHKSQHHTKYRCRDLHNIRYLGYHPCVAPANTVGTLPSDLVSGDVTPT